MFSFQLKNKIKKSVQCKKGQCSENNKKNMNDLKSQVPVK